MDTNWWNSVSNAVRYIEDIVGYMLDNKSIILTCSDIIPWRDNMIDKIIERVDFMDSQRNMRTVICTDEEPGKQILELFCKSEKRASYRPSIGYAKFLAESDDVVLNNTYVWVQGISPEQLDKWVEFVIDYHKHIKKRQTPGIFILETNRTEAIPDRKDLKCVSFNEYMGQYDVYIFNTIISSSLNKSNYYKQYLSELASNIAGSDAELSVRCVEMKDEFLQNPYETVRRITETERRENGMKFDFDMSESRLNKCIWRAQIKIIFPLIEEYREKTVNTYFDSIKDYLPIKTYYNDEISDPSDVDIAILWHIVYTRHMSVSRTDYQFIDILRSARNSLAHIHVLELDDIIKIFEFIKN